MYEHEVKCGTHGKDAKVFVLFETMIDVTEANTVGLIAIPLRNKSLNYNARRVPSNVMFALLPHAEYKAIQSARPSQLLSHNGITTDHGHLGGIIRPLTACAYLSAIFQLALQENHNKVTVSSNWRLGRNHK